MRHTYLGAGSTHDRMLINVTHGELSVIDGSAGAAGSPLGSAAGPTAASASWKSSQYCAGGSCVEVCQMANGHFAIRDGKDRYSSPVLVFTAEEWLAFLSGVKAGEFG